MKYYSVCSITIKLHSYDHNFPVYGKNLRYTGKYRYDSVHIRENTDQSKPQGYDQQRKLFCTNNFVVAHSSAKKIYND